MRREYVPGGKRRLKRPPPSATAVASRPITDTLAPAGDVEQPL
jgi:hypothetical protein